jgi:hypothetical protein
VSTQFAPPCNTIKPAAPTVYKPQVKNFAMATSPAPALSSPAAQAYRATPVNKPASWPPRQNSSLRPVVQAQPARLPAPAVYRPQQTVAQSKMPLQGPPVYNPFMPKTPAQRKSGFQQPPFSAMQHKPLPEKQPSVHRAVPPKLTVQAKFTRDSSFAGNPKLMSAFDIFNKAIDTIPTSNVARLRNSATVDVEFTSGEMETSRAHASMDVPDEWKGDAFCPLTNVAQYHTLQGRTGLSVTVAVNSGLHGSPFLIARTLSHEVAGHIAPYVDILEQIKAGKGLSPADRDRMTAVGPGGSGDHASMVGGGNQEYDALVRAIASTLNPRDALQIAQDYLQDISRYDSKTGRTFDLRNESDKNKFVEQFNKAKTEIDWISDVFRNYNELQRRQIQRRRQRNIAGALLVLLVVYVLDRMFR